jgi:hypothetical protein
MALSFRRTCWLFEFGGHRYFRQRNPFFSLSALRWPNQRMPDERHTRRKDSR